jgi:hypothetical protein
LAISGVIGRHTISFALAGLLGVALVVMVWKWHSGPGETVNAGLVRLEAAEEFPDSNHIALVHAIGRGDVGAIEAATKAGANVNAIGAVRRASPLIWAVLANKPDSVVALLKLGANPNYAVPFPAGFSDWKQDSTGNTDRRFHLVSETAVTEAVRRNNVVILRLLLEGGADPNYVGSQLPPLFQAGAELQNSEINPMLELMLKHGGNVNLKDKQGNSLLQDLITTGKLRTAIYIVEKGADVRALDTKTKIPWSEHYYNMLNSGKVKEQPDDYYRYNYAAYQLFRITGRDGKRGDDASRKMRQMLVDRGIKMETWDPINVARRRTEAGLRVLREEGVPDDVIKTIIRMNKTYEATLTPEYQELVQLGRFLEKEYLNEKPAK